MCSSVHISIQGVYTGFHGLKFEKGNSVRSGYTWVNLFVGRVNFCKLGTNVALFFGGRKIVLLE